MLFKGKLRGYKPSWLPSPSLWVNGTQNMTESDPEHGLRSCGKSGWQARNANHKDRHKKTWQKLDPMTSLLNVTLSHGFLSFDPWTCVMASGTSCIDPSGTKSRRWGIWVGWFGLGTTIDATKMGQESRGFLRQSRRLLEEMSGLKHPDPGRLWTWLGSTAFQAKENPQVPNNWLFV